MSLKVHPENINFQYFEIDTSDIFRYELNGYTEENRISFYHFYDNLKQFLLNNGIKPFLSLETVKNGTHGQNYYDSYLVDRLPKRDKRFPLDFFEHDGCFYNLLTSFVINKENCSEFDFQYFFYMKLRQYEDGLIYVHSFLYFQLRKNFNEDQSKFSKFLQSLLLQFKKILPQDIIDKANGFYSDPQILLSLEKKERTGFDNFPKIPAGYKVIPGTLNREEIIGFFSFLFLEKSADDKPFLNEKKVYDIFKFGIAIPPRARPVQSYKLNCSKTFPKSIIEYCIYKFFTIFTSTALPNEPVQASVKPKKDILRFFAIYFDDFSNALKTEKDFSNFNKNITGEKPERMRFDLQKYLPERFK